MDHDETTNGAEQGQAGAAQRPRRRSGERPAPATGSAPTLRDVARWLGFNGLRQGPHATWARPLAPGSLGARIERARKRLQSAVMESHESQVRMRPVAEAGQDAPSSRDERSKAG